MKKLTVFAVVCCFVLTEPAVAVDIAPDWELTSADGQATRLSVEAEEQVVVLLFWATWCPYCKALMPHLQSMRFEYGDSIEILAINFREKGDPVEFIREKGYDFTILPDGDQVAMQNEIWGTPGVMIVTSGRKVAFDLRDLPPYKPTGLGETSSHSVRAAYLAPYWAAAIRQSIDQALEESSK